MKTFKTLFKIFTSLFVAYILFSFLIFPNILKEQIIKNLNKNLNAQSTINTVSFNPLNLNIHLDELFIGKKTNPIIFIKKADLNFELFKSIYHKKITFSDITLEKLFLNIIHNKKDQLNLFNLLKKDNNNNVNEEKNTINYLISVLKLKNTKITYTKHDGQKPFKISLYNINYRINNLTNLSDLSNLTLFANINNIRNSIVLKGNLSKNPLILKGNLKINNLFLNDILKYKKIINFTCSKNSNIDLSLDYNLNLENFDISLKSKKIQLNDIDIIQDGENILSFKRALLDKFNFDLSTKNISFKSIVFNNLKSHISLNENKFNFENLIIKNPQKNKSKIIKINKEKDNKNWSISCEDIILNTNYFAYKNSFLKMDVKKNIPQIHIKDFSFKNNKIFIPQVISKNIDVTLTDKTNNFLLKGNFGNYLLNNLVFDNKFNLAIKKIDLKKIKILLAKNKNNGTITNESLAFNNILYNSKNELSISSIINKKFNFFTKNKNLKFNFSDLAINKTNYKNKMLSINNIFLNKNIFNFTNKKEKINFLTKNNYIELNNLNILNNSIDFNNLTFNKIYIKFNIKKYLFLDSNINNFKINTFYYNNNNLKTNNMVLNNSISNLRLNNNLFINDKINFIKARDFTIKDNHINFEKINISNQNTYLKQKNIFNLNLLNNKISINNLDTKKNTLKIKKIDINNSSNFNYLNKKLNINTKKLNTVVNNLFVNSSNLKIEDIKFNKPIIQINIEENTDKIIKKTLPINKKTHVDKKNINIKLGKIEINNGKVDLINKNLEIPFKIKFTKLNTYLKNFENTPIAISTLKSNVVVNNYGLANFNFSFNPNNFKFLTNIQTNIENIDLKKLSPYSEKYLGKELSRGKLNLDLKYNIKNSILNANNNIFIKDIQLGRNVESENAKKIPIDLAVTLLKDLNDDVNINLPISGNLSNPDFSIFPIVVKAFINLIFKAITSPFTLLGSALNIDFDDSVNYINFNYGQSAILATQKETLDKLAKILKSKKTIAITLQGTYNSNKDSFLLKKEKFIKNLKKEIPLKSIINKDKKFNKILIKIYKKNFNDYNKLKKSFTKEKILNKDLFYNELNNKLVLNFKLTKKDFETLANKRSNIIKKYFISKKVSAKQIILNKIKQDNSNKKFSKVFFGVKPL